MKKDDYNKTTDKKNGLHNDYRKDWRTDEQFADDIKNAHKIERGIIETYAQHLRLTYGKEFIVEDNGIDNTGEVLELKNVDSRADYKINGILVEVKYNKHIMDEFRFKKDQLISYQKQGAYVLWVNGWETNEPVWTLLDSDDLQEIRETRRAFPYEYWGYKKCYNIKSWSYHWVTFEGLKIKGVG